MKNFIRKFLPLILSVALCLMGAASAVAWVVTNRNLQAKSMAVHVNLPRGVFASAASGIPAAFSAASWTDYDFYADLGVAGGNILNPISTADAVNFYLPNDVLEDGNVNTAVTGDWFVRPASTAMGAYVIDQTFTLCNTYTEAITLRLTNVEIARGTAASGSNLYRAVRVAVITNSDVTQYRVVEGANNYGAACPANGSCSTGTDVSIPAGEQTTNYVELTLPAANANGSQAADDMTMYTVSFRVLIWIEGQNDYAVASYAGTSFRVSLEWDTVT